jgi:hypothetical protein
MSCLEIILQEQIFGEKRRKQPRTNTNQHKIGGIFRGISCKFVVPALKIVKEVSRKGRKDLIHLGVKSKVNVAEFALTYVRAFAG